MASIDRRPNGKWRARWREYPNGPQKTRQFHRKVDAERFLTEVRADLQRGVYLDPAAGLVTFEEYAERWRAVQVHRPSTAAQVESHLRRHVHPVLGSQPMATVRRSHVQALVKGLSLRLAPATVETVYRHVASVFRAAVADRVIAASPCSDIRLPKAERAKLEPLTVAQVEALAAAVPGHVRALIVFAASTGLRQGECFGLSANRVDFLHRRVTVDRQTDPLGSGRFAPLKTEASTRVVPLAPVTLEALSAHLASWRASGDGLMFTDDRGRPWRRNRFGVLWRAVRESAELPEWATFHDLRHFYASLLIRHGESVKVVQDRLGHASAAETLDTYSHLWPDAEDRTRDAAQVVLGSAEDQLRTGGVPG